MRNSASLLFPFLVFFTASLGVAGPTPAASLGGCLEQARQQFKTDAKKVGTREFRTGGPAARRVMARLAAREQKCLDEHERVTWLGEALSPRR